MLGFGGLDGCRSALSIIEYSLIHAFLLSYESSMYCTYLSDSATRPHDVDFDKPNIHPFYCVAMKSLRQVRLHLAAAAMYIEFTILDEPPTRLQTTTSYPLHDLATSHPSSPILATPEPPPQHSLQSKTPLPSPVLHPTHPQPRLHPRKHRHAHIARTQQLQIPRLLRHDPQRVEDPRVITHGIRVQRLRRRMQVV